MRRFKKFWPLIVPMALLGFALFVFLGGEVVKLLWNSLAPPLFNLPVLGFWQALGMLALCRILFGGFGFHGGGQPRGRMTDRMADRMADRLADRWENMTPEERERFRQRFRDRCGFDPTTSEGKAE
jgi:hypothetical protein